MRVTTFLRIARSARGYKVVASRTRPYEPLRRSDDAPLPTAVVMLVLTLSDDILAVPTAQVEIEPHQAGLIVVEPQEVA